MADIKAAVTDNERQMLEELMAGIRVRFGDLLLDARLFGSKARGDSGPESDVDVWLLFRRQLTLEERDEVYGLVFSLDRAHRTYTQVVLDSLQRWEMPGYRVSGFAQAVREEGLPV